MKEIEMTLRQQLDAFENGDILYSDGRTNENGCWGFYDWFCKRSALEGKAKKLMRYVKRFVKAHPELDLDKHYVWFKNNCPINGPLYDDIRITSIGENSKNIWVIKPKSGHSGKAELYHCSDYQNPIVTGKSFADLLVNVEVPVEM